MVGLIRDNLESIQRLCERHRVRRLFLVGSALGTAFEPGRSDIDFLVVFGPQARKGFDDVYFLLLEDLTKLLRHPVDLIEAGAVRNPYFIASLNRTKRMLYAA